jgi:hypothetical protein
MTTGKTHNISSPDLAIRVNIQIKVTVTTSHAPIYSKTNTPLQLMNTWKHFVREWRGRCGRCTKDFQDFQRLRVISLGEEPYSGKLSRFMSS